MYYSWTIWHTNVTLTIALTTILYPSLLTLQIFPHYPEHHGNCGIALWKWNSLKEWIDTKRNIFCKITKISSQKHHRNLLCTASYRGSSILCSCVTIDKFLWFSLGQIPHLFVWYSTKKWIAHNLLPWWAGTVTMLTLTSALMGWHCNHAHLDLCLDGLTL